jgi:hypothetical protein
VGLSGSAAGNYALSATIATTLADITPAVGTATSTLTVSGLTPQYSDQDTFTVTVSSSVPGAPAMAAAFFVGTQGVGTAPLTPVGDPATTTTYKAVWTGPLVEQTTNGQMKPGIHIVSASFVNANVALSNPANKSVNIQREDARVGGLAQKAYTLGASSGVVPLTVTIADITAATGDAATDPFAGDIRNAQVNFIDRATNTVIGTANVSALTGSGTTSGTATLNWAVNLGTASSKTYTIGFSVLNYYTRASTADNVVITVAK